MTASKSKKLVIYQGKGGAIELRGDVERETIWATKQEIAEIFGIDRSVVSKHIKNIFNDSELDAKVACAKFAHTTKHGAIKDKSQTREMDFYNLDIILAVGYRTKSARAIEFRRWATKILRNHLINGYTINKKRVAYNYNKFIKRSWAFAFTD